MLEPQTVTAMLRLRGAGWGTRRIAREFRVSRNTVRRYIGAGGWKAYQQPRRGKSLDGHEAWLRERFERHRGNADVVRQELIEEKGVLVSLRTIERALAPYRRALVAQARATVRFETAPGRQLQIDFGERLVAIASSNVKVFLFVATLGYSRRLYVRAFRDERQKSWFDGLESSFSKFGGIPEEVLIDNPRALVSQHDPATRSVVFNERFLAFAKHWGFRPRACAPYRARTKGKTESGVGYVKNNAIAGREFESWSALEEHLDAWTREVADERIHGTTGETPKSRFERAEAKALKPIRGILPFNMMRDLSRSVASDCTVEVDSNAYSVPWQLIGERVTVEATDASVRIYHGHRKVAVHAVLNGRRQRSIDPTHYSGIAIIGGLPATSGRPEPPTLPDLQRPLSEYEEFTGGAF